MFFLFRRWADWGKGDLVKQGSKAFPSGEGGERSETEEGYKVGIIDGLVEKFCCHTLDSRKLSALVTLFRPRSSGTFPGGEGFFSLPHKFLFIEQITAHVHTGSPVCALREIQYPGHLNVRAISPSFFPRIGVGAALHFSCIFAMIERKQREAGMTGEQKG